MVEPPTHWHGVGEPSSMDTRCPVPAAKTGFRIDANPSEYSGAGVDRDDAVGGQGTGRVEHARCGLSPLNDGIGQQGGCRSGALSRMAASRAPARAAWKDPGGLAHLAVGQGRQDGRQRDGADDQDDQ